MVKTQYWRHKARLGAPSLVHDIRDEGYHVSERTVSRVLQILGLRSKAARKFRYKMDASARHGVAPNALARQFNLISLILPGSLISLISKRGKDGYICV